MPYSIIWTVDPSDSTDAVDIDDEIVKVKDAIKERMNDILVADWEADPLVLKTTITGEVSGLKHFVPFSSFIGVSGGAVAAKYNSNTSVGVFSDSNYVATINVPRGVTITQVDFVSRLNTGVAATLELRHIAAGDTGGASTLDDTLSCAANGNNLWNTYSNSALTITVADAFYYFRLIANSANAHMGAVITYDRPSHLVG